MHADAKKKKEKQSVFYIEFKCHKAVCTKSKNLIELRERH